MSDEQAPRKTLQLSRSVVAELSKIAEERGLSFTEACRVAFGLLKVAHVGEQEGLKTVLAKPNGEIVREVVLPQNLVVLPTAQEMAASESLLRAIADLDFEPDPPPCTALAPFDLLRRAMPS
jgi:hypothetical protein